MFRPFAIHVICPNTLWVVRDYVQVCRDALIVCDTCRIKRRWESRSELVVVRQLQLLVFDTIHIFASTTQHNTRGVYFCEEHSKFDGMYSPFVDTFTSAQLESQQVFQYLHIPHWIRSVTHRFGCKALLMKYRTDLLQDAKQRKKWVKLKSPFLFFFPRGSHWPFHIYPFVSTYQGSWFRSPQK